MEITDMPDTASRRARPRRPFASQLIVGLFVIAIGVLFTLDNLGIVQAQDVLRFWPGALIVVGLVKLYDARERGGGTVGGFVLTLIGLWLLLESTIDIRISIQDMWPMLLVLLGGYLVWRGVAGPRHAAGEDAGSVINAFAILSGVNRGSNSRAFRGGDITAVMGGCHIDLRQAAINGDAAIDVFAMWGGIEIRVPAEWTVESRVTPIMGAVEDKTRPPMGATSNRLMLRGVVIMGGVEVKN